MQIQITADGNIDNNERLAAHIKGVVEGSLGRFSSRITRVEVHLADENGAKSGTHDKRCVMEARLAHHQPTAVTDHAATLDEAIVGAAEKLKRLVGSTLGRLHDT
ncbi:MAG TPA: HPF/RaiA family ribosome-associated protein [Polyangiaceae bacterium]|jgi:hypothetical protein|nr:HPF/RaiA family ribosome-associated protein [Polyangiaceae bacterium]